MATLEESQAVLRQLTPTQEKVDAAIATAIDVAKPSRVFVFGSWARGDAKWDSDLDLAVLIPDSASNELPRIRKELRQALHNIPMSIDLIMAHESYAAEFLESVNSIFFSIIREGRVVYEQNNLADRRSSAA